MAKHTLWNLFHFAEFTSNQYSVVQSIIYHQMCDTETFTSCLILASKTAVQHQMIFKILLQVFSYHSHRRGFNKVLSPPIYLQPHKKYAHIHKSQKCKVLQCQWLTFHTSQVDFSKYFSAFTVQKNRVPSLNGSALSHSAVPFHRMWKLVHGLNL